MENIRQAVERARAGLNSLRPQVPKSSGAPRQYAHQKPQTGTGPQSSEIEANSNYLLSKRIVSPHGADPRSRPYDMLRTQVLQAMTVSGWKIIGVTSPTAGCGKTLTALNLAFSIARQPEQSVVLVDLDLQKPQIAKSLGLTLEDGGLLDLLEERTTLQNVAKTVRAGKHRIVVLPTEATRVSSELIGSRATRGLLQDLRKSYQSHFIIVDLPPILASDDVIAVLPHIDCVLLVAAVGTSKTSEIEEANRHLQSSHLVRLVVNKATEASSNYYYY